MPMFVFLNSTLHSFYVHYITYIITVHTFVSFGSAFIYAFILFLRHNIQLVIARLVFT